MVFSFPNTTRALHVKDHMTSTSYQIIIAKANVNLIQKTATPHRPTRFGVGTAYAQCRRRMLPCRCEAASPMARFLLCFQDTQSFLLTSTASTTLKSPSYDDGKTLCKRGLTREERGGSSSVFDSLEREASGKSKRKDVRKYVRARLK